MLAEELLLAFVGWFAVSIALALLVGRAVRIADARHPRATMRRPLRVL